MSVLSSFLDPIRRLELERFGFLRPSYPPVALEIGRRELVLVRVRRRGGRAYLDAHHVGPLPEHATGSSIFRPNLGQPEEMIRRLRDVLEKSGTRPGRISLVLPDNLAKISLVTLPERPKSRKHLVEILRFKLRRAVPFRMEEAAMAHQILPGGDGPGHGVLVTLMLRPVVEQYEQALVAVGARPGFVALCTPSLFNLCRVEVAQFAEGRRDVALLNCASGYFSLMIVRGERLIFFRCKSLAAPEEPAENGNGVVEREIASSLSYYREKLAGQGIEMVFLRSEEIPPERVVEMLGRMGLERVRVVDPSAALGMAAGTRLDPTLGQRIAPAAGAVAGMGR